MAPRSRFQPPCWLAAFLAEQLAPVAHGRRGIFIAAATRQSAMLTAIRRASSHLASDSLGGLHSSCQASWHPRGKPRGRGDDLGDVRQRIHWMSRPLNAIAQLKQLLTSALLVSDDPINPGPQLLLAHPAGGRCLLAHAAKSSANSSGFES
jgi:hypothetical protein